ncbi:hypothetical protein STENM223S_03248 [Streptomyces tendae]
MARQGVAADGGYATAFDTARARIAALLDRPGGLPPITPYYTPVTAPGYCPASSPATTSAPTGRRCPARPPRTAGPARSGGSCAARRAAPTATACSAWPR